MRPPVLRLSADELVVDCFAGGGGASTGIMRAIKRSPDVAINHDPEAIAMHAVNHPETRHLCGDVWDVRPKELCKGRRIGLAWFSPDCTFHSKARGGKPFRDPKSATGRRGLAWVVVRWARDVKPRVIMLENVEEFADWGPLDDDGKPDPARRGLTFRRWLGQLKAAGYVVEMRELRACDYGAPTSRKRLFIIARSDGQPIVWPRPTHGPGLARAHRPAAECIDWAHACPSIFGRKKPLVEKTLRRIARGIDRFVLRTGEPFIVPSTHGRVNDSAPHSTGAPLRTITAAQRGELMLIAPTLIQSGYGERKGQAPRILDLHAPLGTIVAQGQKHSLVAAYLAKHYGGHEATGTSLRLPLSTITTQDHHALVTVTTDGSRANDVRAFLTRYNGTGLGQSLQLSLGTVTTRDRFGLVTVHGTDYAIADIGQRMLQPRELFRAQGFADSYVIDRAPDGGSLSKTAQIRLCGNSVPPAIAAALVSANLAGEEVAAA